MSGQSRRQHREVPHAWRSHAVQMVMPSPSADLRTASGSRILLWFSRSHTGASTISPVPSCGRRGGYLGFCEFRVLTSSRTDSSSMSLCERCSSWRASARRFVRMNSQIARTPPCEMLFAKSFSSATWHSCCARVSRSIQTIWLLMRLWLKSTSPRQRRSESLPCSSRIDVSRTRSHLQYLSMPASDRGGSRPPMEILRSQLSPPRRRRSKPRRATRSMRRGVQWSSSSSRAAIGESPSSSSSLCPMSAQLRLLLLPAGVFSCEAVSPCELARSKSGSPSSTAPGRRGAFGIATASPSLSEPEPKASPSSSPRRARRPGLTGPSNLASRPGRSARLSRSGRSLTRLSRSCLGSSSRVDLPLRFSIFRQTDCRMEDRFRQ
mmetsp:Transcript_61694/g.180949  ORF Transcript_61694/g.180949 Transcript_61694/m.180949 type:complete len:379 (+) Transcript_61694:422-1558(+)